MPKLIEKSPKVKTIRLLIADDKAEIRNSLKLMLSTYDHIEVVGIAENGLEALSMTHIYEPEVILLDIEMPKMNGIEAAKLIREEIPETKVLIFSAFDTPDYIKQIFLSRAQGYIVKSEVDDVTIIKAIETVHSGGLYFSKSPSSVLQNILNENIDGPLSHPNILSERELKIIGLLAHKSPKSAIAEEFHYDLTALERHIQRIQIKLSLHSEGALTQFAHENGLL